MHIVFVTHSFSELHGMSTLLSWALIVGAVYGVVRLVIDCFRQFRRADRAWRSRVE